jgi:P-type Mg2+ transporter
MKHFFFNKKRIKERAQIKIPFWSMTLEAILDKLEASKEGLGEKEAYRRLKLYGENLLKAKKKSGNLQLFFNQFKSPLILIFLLTAILSVLFKEHIDSTIIFSIVFLSGFLGFFQERKAVRATEKLISMVKIKSEVLRDNTIKHIPTDQIALGDVILFNAGDVVPADCYLIESKDLFTDEAMLTGESFGVEKMAGVVSENSSVNKRSNMLFMGSHVISGIAKALVVSTGKNTQFGHLLEDLKTHGLVTDFEKTIKKISLFLMNVTMILVTFIFIFNIVLEREIITSILFALALAIGLSPQLLPAIITINLSHGTRRMKQKRVIVKRLACMENFGAMNILCSDKTGTLTEGKIKFHSSISFAEGVEEKIALFSYLNSKLQTGYTNLIDQAILDHFKSLGKLSTYQKIDELPYDFKRKRLTIVTQNNSDILMITKGAFFQVLECCTSIEKSGNKTEKIDKHLSEINEKYEEFARQGFKVLGIGYRKLKPGDHVGKELEKEMVFLGFLIFFDPIKPDIKATISALKKSKIDLKIITGDNAFSATYIANHLQLIPDILVGKDLDKLNDKELAAISKDKNIFAEVDPIQKERIIRSFKAQNNVVGYLGDGINDASALHIADIGISVNSAADAAKETADIILLDKSLKVLLEGVKEGRKTFANTLKYIFMATSANFGNMFSMAGGSLFLKFLPLLPEQILFNNLLTDISQMTIATDSVDQELLDKPVKLNINFVAKFMLVFGLISSIFDYVTFFALLYLFHASPEQFRTGWFIESVISATAIILVIRTKKPFFKSRPSNYLIFSVFSVIGLTLIVPFTYIGSIFHLDILSFNFYLFIIFIMVLYVLITEIGKKLFYRNHLVKI